jgi:tetratricopeptide (TPR) repeat protein
MTGRRFSKRNLQRVFSCVILLFPLVASAGLPPALLVENHSDVFVPWIANGVRGAVVVNVDAHDDCDLIAPVKAEKLRRLLKAGDMAAIGRANGGADSSLYTIANYIAAACAVGMATEAVWVAPTVEKQGLLNKTTPFRVRTCPIELLPEIHEPVLLTVDADIIPSFAAHRNLTVVEAAQRIGKNLRAAPWRVVHTSVCVSNDGRYLPVTLRWIANALQEALDGKELSRPGSPWPLLGRVEDWRRSLLPAEFVRRVKPLLRDHPVNPWLHLYLSDAHFKADDVTDALNEGIKAARLDPGCCRILPEIGGQLADADRIDEAEKFFAAAPGIVNIDAELSYARALDRAGKIAQSITPLSRISAQTSMYGPALLIGYAYEKLGDTLQAGRSYRRMIALLRTEPGSMPAYPEVGPALNSAEKFLRLHGEGAMAQLLREDPRTGTLFGSDSDK